jgi:allantoin racemase
MSRCAKHVPDMKILVINPNTTESMTTAIEAAAKAVAAPGTEVRAVTSAIGPASIEGFYDEAFAVPGVIAALRDAPDIDAAVIGCFDDTGLDAARSFAACPVVGICEAGLIVAGQLSKRIGVVTTLSRSVVPLEELVNKYGYRERAKVYACDVAVLDIERPGSNARAKIEAEMTRALTDGADAILLGCAGMTGLTAELSSAFGVPVVDGVTAAVKQAEALAALGLKTSKRGAYAAPLEKTYRGAVAGFSPCQRESPDNR